MGLGTLPFVERVDVSAEIGGVTSETLEGPSGKGTLEVSRVRMTGAMPVETQIPPREGLVEEGLHVGVAPPEALPLPSILVPQVVGGPRTKGPEGFLRHLLDGDVAVMKVGGETRGVPFLGGQGPFRPSA